MARGEGTKYNKQQAISFAGFLPDPDIRCFMTLVRFFKTRCFRACLHRSGRPTHRPACCPSSLKFAVINSLEKSTLPLTLLFFSFQSPACDSPFNGMLSLWVAHVARWKKRNHAGKRSGTARNLSVWSSFVLREGTRSFFFLNT